MAFNHIENKDGLLKVMWADFTNTNFHILAKTYSGRTNSIYEQ